MKREMYERNNIEKKLRHLSILIGVLNGIADIIGVYKIDNTIMFYNQAGYDFYKKSFSEVNGKKCYEMLNRTKKCPNCLFEIAVKTKQIIRKKKYIPEVDKYIEFTYNPVLDDFGEVIFVVEQLRDITEKKKLDNIIKESEERYKQIVELLPDATIIIVNGKIVLANKEALKYYNDIVGESADKYIPGFVDIQKKRGKQILENKIKKTIFDYKIDINDSRELDIEVASSYIEYNGKPAILSIMRDITERKRELNSAAKIQKELLRKPFPIEEKAKMETVYIPAKTVSGDFFYIHKVNDEFIIGILGDVSGKGITAALNISAFNVLFNEEVLVNHDPYYIIEKLNKKIVKYLGERYVAACCFSFDFKKNIARIVGAGINQFIYQNEYGYNKKVVKGPFLGMFENSMFDEQIINFQSKDKFYFFTDGLDFIFDDDKIIGNYLKEPNIKELKRKLKISINNILSDVEGIKDDCTMLALEIN